MMYMKEPTEDFTVSAVVKDYVYVGSIIKCIVELPNGNEIRIERLAGQELPELGETIYPCWNPRDAVIIRGKEHDILNALDSIKLA
jgi:spermidine/putrescine transport system ATP-binding protein